MSIYLIRHTAVVDAEDHCYGRTDLPLADDFEPTLDHLLIHLPQGPHRIFSSPSARCVCLAQQLGSKVVLDERLRELNFGKWEGRRWTDIPRAELDLWGADFVNRPPPGGESFSALVARAEEFIAEISLLHPTETILCVTHAGVIRALLATHQGIALKDAFSIRVLFGGLYVLPPKPDTPSSIRP